MIQILLYQTRSVDPVKPQIVDYDGIDKRKTTEECSLDGTISVMSRSTLDLFRKDFDKKGFLDCGVKGKRIDIKRALGFNLRKNRNVPKILFFDSENVGAIKRGLYAFLKSHYTAVDPPCLIVVPDDIQRILVRDEMAPGIPDQKKKDQDRNDPLFRLMNIPGSEPVIRQLEKVLIGDSLEMRHVRALVYRASRTGSPVLILGETGTGKDLIATQIYEHSNSFKRAFSRINCSALPENLLEAELFGYEKGIFTGADKNKTGLFKATNGGTLFLDEIGDLSMANQVKLLHAVEKKEIRQIGSNKGESVDVRIIAATNRKLDAMVMQGSFREDLYYRISTLRIISPPLNEHPEDIPLLAEKYRQRQNRKGKFSAEFLDYLKECPWPGNVRELYSLLNSFFDYFGDISPTPAHIEAIRKSRQEILYHSRSCEGDDPAQMMKLRSQNTLIAVQNLLRSVKIEMRPVIHPPAGSSNEPSKLDKLKKFLIRQNKVLGELCTEPTWFRSWELYKATARYRYLLEKTIQNWPSTANELSLIWNAEFKIPDNEINQEIMDVLWGKIDM